MASNLSLVARAPVRGDYPGSYPRLRKQTTKTAAKVRMPAVSASPPPAPSLGAAAQAFIAAQFKPLADQIAQSTQAGQRAITGYQTEAARVLGGLPVKLGDLANLFTTSFGNVAKGTTDAIAGQGSQAASELASTLAARGQSTAPADEIAANGMGAAGASAALGNAALARLAGFGKSATDLAAKLPYIGYLQGLKDTQNLAYKGSQDTAALQEKAISLLPTVLQSMQAAEDRRAAAQATADYRASTAKATAGYRADQLKLSRDRLAQGDERIGIASRNADTAATRASNSQANADRNYELARRRLNLAERKRADALEQKVKTGGYTKSQLVGFGKRAQQIASDAWYGTTTTTKAASGVPPGLAGGGASAAPAEKTHKSYQQAMRDGLAAGIPLTIMQKALNAYWTKPGQTAKWEAPGEGRPKQSYQERNPGKAGAADTAAASTPEGAKQTAFRIAQSKYGWGANELAALEQLWNGESGWDYHAWNQPGVGASKWLADNPPPKGAFGIPQALGHKLPADYASNPVAQINWGLDYIKRRYGTPSRALAFWSSNSPHWY